MIFILLECEAWPFPVEMITDVRDYARKHTKAAIDLHVTAMNDEKLGMRVRLAAAKELIERGHGKGICGFRRFEVITNANSSECHFQLSIRAV